MLNFENFMETLPISGLGLLGVFIVMALVYISVKVLCRLFKADHDKADSNPSA